MAHLYAAGVTKTTGAAAGPIATVLTAAGSRGEILEIGVFIASAVAADIGIGRPAANGVGGATGVVVQAEDSNDVAGVTTLVSSFATTQPTAPTNPMRRISLPATIGAGIIWSWNPSELMVPVSSNFVIWQFTAVAVAYNCYVRVRE
jgi:hypothetical protein